MISGILESLRKDQAKIATENFLFEMALDDADDEKFMNEDDMVISPEEKKKLDDDVIVGYYALLKDIEKKYTNKKAKESYESAAKDLEEIDLELLEKI